MTSRKRATAVFALGAVCYLRKPIEGDLLLDSIQQALTAKRNAPKRRKDEAVVGQRGAS